MRKWEDFEIFGGFILLDWMGCGGMAEVFLARPCALNANGRILVIKRLLPQVMNDPVFIKMFRAEIQVCMGFNHPNIVQIFDFGQVRNQLYIAMELVQGKNLRETLSHVAKQGTQLPVEIAVSIAAQTAAGLHYAHTFTNKGTGVALNVIHRDISPQNIILSYDGNVKLIDFGIAKAEVDASEHTEDGTIKGKVSYLSPEQAWREPLDCRSDTFSLGAVLWELLTGKKLFSSARKDNLEVIEKIKHSDKHVVPPSSVNTAVPPELDAIVMKALARKREDRFASAEELQTALRGFLLKAYPGFGYLEVGKFAKTFFKEQLMEEQMYVRALNDRAQAMLERSQEGTVSVPSRRAARSFRRWFVAGGLAGAIGFALAAAPDWIREQMRGPQPDIRMAQIALPAEALAPPIPAPRQSPSAALQQGIQSTQNAMKSARQIASIESQTQYDADPDPEPSSPFSRPTRFATLRLDLGPVRGRPSIMVNNQHVDSKTRSIRIRLDRKVSVSVKGRSFAPYTNEFRLTPQMLRGSRTYILHVALKPLH